MSDRTRNFGWLEFGPGSRVDENGFEFGTKNLEDIDQKMWELFTRRPGAVAATEVDLTLAPTLSLDTTQGALPAGARIFYVYTLVDAEGGESLPSPESFIDTPAAVQSPSAPVLTLGHGGAIEPGSYQFALSAYRGDINHETLAPSTARVLVPVGATDWTITLTLPVIDDEADGFNVYWRRPGSDTFYLLDSIDMTLATPPTTYVVVNRSTEDAHRSLPRTNNTNAQNAVEIALPGATPDVPDGYTWRIYRSYVSAQYAANTLLHWVVEETSEGSGVTTPVYTDLGLATVAGQPPSSIVALPAYPKIDLTDASEVQGVLPPANLVYLGVERFVFPGPLTDTLVGTFVWTFPFQLGQFRWVITSLGFGSSPQVDDVIVDVKMADPNSDSFSTIYPTSDPPTIAGGQNTSPAAVPDVVDLVMFQRIKIDLTQIGGGASPTDADLLVQLVYWYWDSTATTVPQP